MEHPPACEAERTPCQLHPDLNSSQSLCSWLGADSCFRLVDIPARCRQRVAFVTCTGCLCLHRRRYWLSQSVAAWASVCCVILNQNNKSISNFCGHKNRNKGHEAAWSGCREAFTSAANFSGCSCGNNKSSASIPGNCLALHYHARSSAHGQ